MLAACTQVVAGLRCRKNKTEFLLRSLAGHRWGPDELFCPEAAARPEAAALLSAMSSILQRSSSIAVTARRALLHANAHVHVVQRSTVERVLAGSFQRAIGAGSAVLEQAATGFALPGQSKNLLHVAGRQLAVLPGPALALAPASGLRGASMRPWQGPVSCVVLGFRPNPKPFKAKNPKWHAQVRGGAQLPPARAPDVPAPGQGGAAREGRAARVRGRLDQLRGGAP